MSRTAEFRALHRSGDPLLLPNAWDLASAAALVDAGFRALGTTSLGVAAAHGLPDGHGRTRAETMALARRLAYLPCLLTVDVEAGFGRSPDEVADVVAELAGYGVVGVNLEDGRADGTLTPTEEQCALIGAVKARVPRLFLNARTDPYWLATDPAPLASARDRARAYRAAGADGIFVPGVTDGGDIAALVAATDAPLNVLYSPGRLTVERAARLGVARISCGSLLFRAALHAAVETARAVVRDAPVAPGLPGYAEVTALIDRYAGA